MKKIRQLFSHISTQIILIVGITVVLVLSAMVMFFYNSTVSIIQTNTIYSNEIVLEQINKNFESYIEELQDFTLNVRMDNSILSAMESDDLNYVEQKTVSDYLRTMYYSRHDLYDLSLHMLESDTLFRFSRNTKNISVQKEANTEKEAWYEKAASDDAYLCVLPVSPSANLPSWEISISDPLLKVYRIIINAYSRKPLAVVEITCDMTILKHILEDLVQDNASMISLTDGSGTPYFISSAALTPLTGTPGMPAGSASSGHIPSIPIDGIDYLLVNNQSEKQSWRLTKYISLDSLTALNGQSKTISMVSLAVATIFSLCVIALLVHFLTQSLRLLSKQMIQAGKGDLKTHLTEKGSYETKMLARRYNSMITKIDDLIHKNYVMEINEKTAKLQALESQINPHFLYNSLQVISSHTILSGDRDTCKMIESLADNLRYAFKESVLVHIRLEVRYVCNYLLLLQARFEDRLITSIDVGADTETLQIPKLAIFTLIENSVVHGLEKSRTPLNLKLTIRHEQDELIISVTDNGPGIEPFRLNEIQAILDSETELTSNGDHLGLRNLNARLMLYFGDKASLTISSIPGIQTTSTITISTVDKKGSKNV